MTERFRNEAELKEWLDGQKKPARKFREKETNITKQIQQILKSARIWHWKHWGGPMSKKGVSDILGIKKVKVSDLVKEGVEEVGVMLAIEVKRPGEKPTYHQTAFIDDIRRECGIAFCADSVDEVIDRLGIQVILTPLLGRKNE